MPFFIRWAQRTSSVQPINTWAPDSHQNKAKTPTMGGIVFIGATLIASLLTVRLSNPYALGALLTLFLFALIGFQDDYSKVRNNANLHFFAFHPAICLQLFHVSFGGTNINR